jgi:dipeptidyl aminopeptidase/acylaminoacyl peptidase
MPTIMASHALSRFLSLSACAALPAAAYLLGLYLGQDRLVFKPMRKPEGSGRADRGHRVVPIEFPVARARLNGWLLLPRDQPRERVPTILYFGGRSEEVSWVPEKAHRMFPGMAVLALNYRGYGASTGSPAERHLYGDALAQYEFLSALSIVDDARIAVMGRSLGTGVATYLAAKRKLAAAILLTPYDSIEAIAQRRFPFAPVRLLLRHKFDACSYAQHAECPALVLQAERDDVVPHEHTERYVQAWRRPVQRELIAGTDHHDIPFHDHTHGAVRAFLRRHLFGESANDALAALAA